MNNNMSKVLLGLLVSVGFLSSANADTKVEEEVLIAPAKAQEVKSVVTVTQVGSNSEKLPVLKGFAKDLSLLTVMQQITPKGWTVKKELNDSLNVQKVVSWEGGKNWFETLTTLANEYNFNVKVDWNVKSITLSSTGIPDKLEKKHVFVVSKAEKVEVAKAEKVEVAKIETPKIESVKVWELKSGVSLKHNVKAWTDKMGWDLVWTGENYLVDVGVLLQGDLDSEDGPVAQLAVAYKDAKQPLTFTIKEDNHPITLVVRNVEFEQRFVKEQK